MDPLVHCSYNSTYVYPIHTSSSLDLLGSHFIVIVVLGFLLSLYLSHKHTNPIVSFRLDDFFIPTNRRENTCMLCCSSYEYIFEHVIFPWNPQRGYMFGMFVQCTPQQFDHFRSPWITFIFVCVWWCFCRTLNGRY